MSELNSRISHPAGGVVIQALKKMVIGDVPVEWAAIQS
jgi:hypothetical protein